MTFAGTRQAAVRAYHDLLDHRNPQAAAALSYYSILGVFPALIFLSAALAYIPIPGLFSDVLIAMGRVTPPGAMPIVYSVLKDILSKNQTAWLSFGMAGTIWLVSAAFDQLIDSLDTAYDIPNHRPFWKTRLLAVALAAITGVLLTCAIVAMIIGPVAGGWIAGKLYVSGLFLSLWPFLHWIIAVSFSVFAVELIYFIAPNAKQSFLTNLPGAMFSVAGWIGLSYLLGIYFRHFQGYNRTYGTLGGLMALMTWLYWAYFILLAGGEFNSELAKANSASRSVRSKPSTPQRLDTAA